MIISGLEKRSDLLIDIMDTAGTSRKPMQMTSHTTAGMTIMTIKRTMTMSKD